MTNEPTSARVEPLGAYNQPSVNSDWCILLSVSVPVSVLAGVCSPVCLCVRSLGCAGTRRAVLAASRWPASWLATSIYDAVLTRRCLTWVGRCWWGRRMNPCCQPSWVACAIDSRRPSLAAGATTDRPISLSCSASRNIHIIRAICSRLLRRRRVAIDRTVARVTFAYRRKRINNRATVVVLMLRGALLIYRPAKSSPNYTT